MTNTKLIAQHLTLLECEEQAEKRCKICGETATKYFNSKKIISEKFNDLDACKCKVSDVICVYCATCIKDASLRRSCFYADNEKLIFFKKNDIENLIFNLPVSPPFVFCFTQSFKKHNSFKAKINYSSDKYYIESEGKRFKFETRKMEQLYNVIKQAYFDDLMSKEEILSGKYTTLIDVQKLIEYEKIFSVHRGNEYFDFLVYILNSEIKNEILKKRKEEIKNARKSKK